MKEMIHIYILLIQIIFIRHIAIGLKMNCSDMKEYIKRIQDIIFAIGGANKFISFVPIVLIYFYSKIVVL
jgi:hypothetical protein